MDLGLLHLVTASLQLPQQATERGRRGWGCSRSARDSHLFIHLLEFATMLLIFLRKLYGIVIILLPLAVVSVAYAIAR